VSLSDQGPMEANLSGNYPWEAFVSPRFTFAIEVYMSTMLDDRLLAQMAAYWRASNYLSVGQIYLLDNPRSAHNRRRI
jgi:XFP N-terminal domain